MQPSSSPVAPGYTRHFLPTISSTSKPSIQIWFRQVKSFTNKRTQISFAADSKPGSKSKLVSSTVLIQRDEDTQEKGWSEEERIFGGLLVMSVGGLSKALSTRRLGRYEKQPGAWGHHHSCGTSSQSYVSDGRSLRNTGLQYRSRHTVTREAERLIGCMMGRLPVQLGLG